MNKCPNENPDGDLVCVYWKYSIPQSKCWLASLHDYPDSHCLVEDTDLWFQKLFRL